MRTILFDSTSKIIRNKKILEKKLDVKIKIVRNRVEIEGNELSEFFAFRVIDAIKDNFPLEIALLLLEEDYLLEKINIKGISRRTNRKEVRARVIGREGKTISLLGELSDSFIAINDNVVSLIGPADKMDIAMHALEALIRGSKQSSVYSYLEKQRKRYFNDKIEFKELKHKESNE